MEEKTVDLQSLIFELGNVAKYGHKKSDLYRVCIEAKIVIEEYRNLLNKKRVAQRKPIHKNALDVR